MKALLFPFTALSAASASGAVVGRFGIVTDVHYADIDAGGTRHYRDSLPKMRDAIATFTSFSGPAGSEDAALDFIVELGDLKDKAAGNDVNATIGYLDAIESALASSGLPTYHVLGNHDVDILDQPTCVAHAQAQPADVAHGPALGAYSFDIGGGGGGGGGGLQPDGTGCLVATTSSPNVWVVHNDSTRNWLSKPAPALCRAKALVVGDVGVYRKRHGGGGAYNLNATLSAAACAQLDGCAAPGPPPSAPATVPGPLHFVVLNGNFDAAAVPWAAIDAPAPGTDFSWKSPWVPSPQVEWLAQDLAAAAARGQKAIVFVHYRVDGGPGMHQSGWVNTCTLDNALVVRDVLASSGIVLATFSGHDHYPKPPFTVGAGPMAPDLLMFTHSAMVEGSHATSNAYSVVTVFDNCTVAIDGFGNTTSLLHGAAPGCTMAREY